MSTIKYSRVCTLDGCFNKRHARGLCQKHYCQTDFKRLSNKEYRQRNPEKLKTWSKQRRLRCRERKHIKPNTPRVLLTEEQKAQKRLEATRAWRAKNPERNRELNRLAKLARRARTANAKIVKKIDKKKIHNWFTHICGICDLPIQGEFHIDHKIPLSRGGYHIETNLQLAHPRCNRLKSNKLIEKINVVS